MYESYAIYAIEWPGGVTTSSTRTDFDSNASNRTEGLVEKPLGIYNRELEIIYKALARIYNVDVTFCLECVIFNDRSIHEAVCSIDFKLYFLFR